MLGILKGMSTTLSTMLRKPVTIQYPDVHHALSERDRAFPILLWDHEVVEPFCTGCHACERNCPVECMTVIMKDNPKFKTGESKRRKIIDRFWIDYGRCMRCNICVEVCNFDAIAMNNTWQGHELSRYDRKDLVLDLQQLLAQSKAGHIKEWVPETVQKR
jgi:formate hydrogenlyase subunit 6/NADH:ubiquinone oxidoreductase subunit I